MKLKIPPPLQALFFALMMWWIDGMSTMADFTFPGQLILAGVFLLIGILIPVIAIRTFHHAETTINPFTPDEASALVIKGVYRYTRNPMYVGLLFALVALWLFFGDLFGIIPIVLFVFTLTELQIKPEEKALTEKFGDAYQDYMKQVRRWL